ncbi:MAG: hypothetical protein HY530_01625 [Chloroflexi bacterium]|nr:hypothetical protein [Chloroflexota bacterium]
MADKARVILCGLGAVGREIARTIVEKRDMEIVAATDISDKLVGKDVGQVIGIGRDIGVTISGNVSKVVKTVDADVVILATTSYFKDIYDVAKQALEAGKNVMSPGEQAGFPWTDAPDLARRIDDIARKKGVTFVGTGMTPGFFMDYLPISLTSAVRRVDRIIIRGVANWGAVSAYDFELAGFGKTIEEFNEGVAKGRVVGLMCLRALMEETAQSLGWSVDEYKEAKRGIISKSRRVADHGVVEPGTVCGFEQNAHGFYRGKEVITYNRMYFINPTLEEDGVEVGFVFTIEGEPGLECSLKGGVVSHVVLSTAARMVNSIPQVITAPPGLLSVYELASSPCLP